MKNWTRHLMVLLALVGALSLATPTADAAEGDAAEGDAAVGVAAVGVAAEEEEGAGDDIQARIRKQMEKIRKLMQENETALLDLSAGTKARPKKVDVDVVPPEGMPPEGRQGGEGGSDGATGKSGEETRKAIDELLRKQQESGEPIPEEITRLVKMIPL